MQKRIVLFVSLLALACSTDSATVGVDSTPGDGDFSETSEVIAEVIGDLGASDVQATPDTPQTSDIPQTTDAVGPACDEGALSELYTQYVEPFVSGAVSQSCSQCHMTGIDMSMYAQDTPCQTLACMVNLDAVDLDDPASSAILAQILMGSPNSSVFDVDMEYQAMLEWISWSGTCHQAVCGEISDACNVGTGAESTGVTPLGDCTEDDLLASFWDSVIVDRGRCVTCHSSYAVELGTFGPCASEEDCEDPQLCVDGLCYSPYPLNAPHFFEGGCTGEKPNLDCNMKWNNAEHKQIGLNTMHNILALGLVDTESPLDSLLLTKPLLEEFQPLAIYGPGVEHPNIPEGEGVGVYHGGTSKFSFGCAEPPCLTSGVVDCRKSIPCGSDADCGESESCITLGADAFCRVTDSVCDYTYANFVRFVEYYAECSAK